MSSSWNSGRIVPWTMHGQFHFGVVWIHDFYFVDICSTLWSALSLCCCGDEKCIWPVKTAAATLKVPPLGRGLSWSSGTSFYSITSLYFIFARWRHQSLWRYMLCEFFLVYIMTVKNCFHSAVLLLNKHY